MTTVHPRGSSASRPPAAGGAPVVGITADLSEATGVLRAGCAIRYAERVAAAGGCPVLLPPLSECLDRHVALCDAVVLTGGDDPATEPFGVPTHPEARRVHPQRQAYETALLRVLAERAPDRPALGICLGMQMMALCAGGRLDQHLPEGFPTHARHAKSVHGIELVAGSSGGATLGPGQVWSNHRQAVSDPGRLEIIARSDDGLIEAIADQGRAFYVGVQWHPERTEDAVLGRGLFERLVAAARAAGAA